MPLPQDDGCRQEPGRTGWCTLREGALCRGLRRVGPGRVQVGRVQVGQRLVEGMAKHQGVVVDGFEVDPTDGALVVLSPSCDEGGLPVTAWGQDANDSTGCGPILIVEAGPFDDLRPGRGCEESRGRPGKAGWIANGNQVNHSSILSPLGGRSASEGRARHDE